jgi:hypothetical protein
MDRRTLAAWSVAVGVGLGLLGNLAFYGKQIGLSFPLFIGAALLTLLALSRAAQIPILRRNLWPILPIMFFAGMVAVRADGLIVTLNILAVLTLGALLIHYLPLRSALDEAGFEEQIGAAAQVGIAVLPMGVIQTVDAWGWLRERRQQRGALAASILRGLIFALPILAVFVILLGSADAVFARYVAQAVDSVRRLLGLEYIDDAIAQAIFTGALALIATGGLGYALARRLELAGTSPAPKPAEGETADDFTADLAIEEKRKPAFKLSMIESGIVMGGVVLLFAAFVLIQFAYFFGGRATLELTGLTFSQYARRGFFELVAVSVLTLGMGLGLRAFTVRQGKTEETLFRVLILLIVALTSVMLISAAQRMWLYEEAFGFTQLRVYTHVSMGWLGILFVVFAAGLFITRKNLFSLGILLSIIGYLVTLNVMNIDYYIAERNVARYWQNPDQELDVAFLDILSVDAAPVIARLYSDSALDSIAHQWAGQWLARQLLTLQNDSVGLSATVFSYNVSRANTLAALSAQQNALPAFDPSLYWRSVYAPYSTELLDYDANYRSGSDQPPTAVPR